MQSQLDQAIHDLTNQERGLVELAKLSGGAYVGPSVGSMTWQPSRHHAPM
jgi:hypothetical protein